MGTFIAQPIISLRASLHSNFLVPQHYNNGLQLRSDRRQDCISDLKDYLSRQKYNPGFIPDKVLPSGFGFDQIIRWRIRCAGIIEWHFCSIVILSKYVQMPWESYLCTGNNHLVGYAG